MALTMLDELSLDDCKWTLRFYRLADTEFPLSRVDASQLLVVPFDAAVPIVLWDDSARNGRGRGFGVGGGSGVVDDALDADDDDGEAGRGMPDDSLLDDDIIGPDGESLKFMALELELALEACTGVFAPSAPETPPDPPPSVGAAASSDLPHPGPLGPPAPALHFPVPSDIVVNFGTGSLTWYRSSDTIVANCKTHGKACRITKTCNPKRVSNAAAGRPLGLLAAWLLACDAAHGDVGMNMACHIGLKHTVMTHDERFAGRLILLDTPGSEAIFSKEKDEHLGHEVEPEESP